MKTTLLTLFCFFSFVFFAQSNISLTIFNNGGQQFFVIMNGIKQNSLPKTNVKIGGMSAGSYEIKLIFADGKTADINKKIWIDEDGDYVARIVMKGKKHKLQYFGVTNQSQPLPAGSESINYRPDEQTVYSDNTNIPVQSTQGTDASNGQISPSGAVEQGTPTYVNGTTISSGLPQTSVQTTTPTDPQTGQAQPEMTSTVIINADPNYGQGGTNISNTTGGQSTTFGSSVAIPDPNIPAGFGVHINIQEPTSTTTTTTTTTTYGTSIQGTSVTSGTVNPGMNSEMVTPTPSNPEPVTSANCTMLMEDIDGFMVRLNDETFEADKKELVKNELAYKCLSSDNGYRILNAFTFEADKLELAKYLYIKLTDRQNGARFNELFEFDATKKEFTNFMKTH